MRFKSAKFRRALGYQIFLIPALIMYVSLNVVPLIMSVFYSFTDLSMHRPDINFVGLRNYINLFDDAELMASISNTLFFAFTSTILINIFAILLAVGLDRKMRGVNFMRMIIFAPAVLSSLMVGYVWAFILSSLETGLANTLLTGWGIIDGPINWLGDPQYALFSIIFIFVWQWAGWCMVIYLANLQMISTDYYEVAEIDGANGFQKFFYITLPLLITAVTINTVLFMIIGLRVYDIIIATTGGGPGFATESITTVLVKRVFGLSQFGYGSSIATVLLVIIMFITIIQLGILKIWERKVL